MDRDISANRFLQIENILMKIPSLIVPFSGLTLILLFFIISDLKKWYNLELNKKILIIMFFFSYIIITIVFLSEIIDLFIMYK